MTAGPSHSSETTRRQPPAAERARTVAARPTSSLCLAGSGICGHWGAATTADGDVLVVVPTDGPVMNALRNSPLGDVPARLIVTDRTPIPMPHPVRGLVQLSGWITPIPADDVQPLVLDFADAYPCDSLFDVGLTATLVRLDLAEVVLEEAGGTTDIEPEEYLAARPDAISAAETDLMTAEPETLGRLSRRVQGWAGRHADVRLLGLDRFGVRFRVQSRQGCYDLRVPFTSPLDSPAGFGGAIAHLLTCGRD
jgi:hypothetical protein